MSLLPPDPIIVLGMGTSGSRLVVRLLEQCGVFMGGRLASNEYGEPTVFYKDANAFVDTFRYHVPLRHDWSKLVDRHSSRLRAFCRGVLPSHFRQAGYIAGPWGFKDPRNTFTAGIYTTEFPESRVLHVVRDGLDVAESKLRQDWPNLPPNRDLQYWLAVWAQVVKVACSYEALGSSRYRLVRYEDVCQNRPEALDGLTWAARCGPQDVQRAVDRTANTGRIGKLLQHEAIVQSLSPDAARLREQLGYGQ